MQVHDWIARGKKCETVRSSPECRLYLWHFETLSDPDPRSRIAAACGSAGVIAPSCENTADRAAGFRTVAGTTAPDDFDRKAIRPYTCVYLAKVHRTSGARTGFSRPIIKMHARYVTTLCTYVPKYYPAPVPALSLSLSLATNLVSYTGCPNLPRLRSNEREGRTDVLTLSNVTKLISGHSIILINLLFSDRSALGVRLHASRNDLRGPQDAKSNYFARRTVVWTTRKFWLPESLHSRHDFSNRSRIIPVTFSDHEF